MRASRVSRDEQIQLIMECRQSGLSDYQWCKANNIYPATFYNWVSKLKKSGYTFPISESKNRAVPVLQEVVKVDLVQREVTAPKIIEQNTSYLASDDKPAVAAELLLGDVTLRLYNGSDPAVVQSIMQCMGGRSHAW